MKKVLAVLLVLCCIVSLGACSKGASYTPMTKDEFKSAFNTAVAASKKGYDDVKSFEDIEGDKNQYAYSSDGGVDVVITCNDKDKVVAASVDLSQFAIATEAQQAEFGVRAGALITIFLPKLGAEAEALKELAKIKPAEMTDGYSKKYDDGISITYSKGVLIFAVEPKLN